MKIYIIIPAHNEADLIAETLESLTKQSLRPEKIIVVDDQSSDHTAEVVEDLVQKYPLIQLVKAHSSEAHLPGSKIVNAFYTGYEHLDEDYDIICKFDADLVFPRHYLRTIAAHFASDEKVGMAGGFCHLKKDGEWTLENLTGKDHIRGALKAYRKECFKQIGGLKPSMGWDTVDELLAQYHGWKVVTDASLAVKHKRPTGITYNQKAKYKQGAAFYKLRYGFLITLIASAKLAVNKKKPQLIGDYLAGFFKAKKDKTAFLVSQKEGAFIRKLRYKKMISKLF